MEVDHFSVSQLEMYQRCGKQYEYRYVDGQIVPPGVDRIRGTGVHRAAAVNYRHKRDAGADLPVDAVLDAARDSVVASFAQGVSLSPDEASRGVEQLRARTVDAAVAMARAHRQDVAPTVQPDLVEATFDVKIKSLPLPLRGILDLRDTAQRIHDLKTKTDSPPKDAADRSQQLTAYALLHRASTGKPEAGLRLTNIVRTEAGKISVLHQDSHRSDQDIRALMDKMRLAIHGIEAGVFMPTNPANWWCAAKWCGYWHQCPFASRLHGG